VGQVVFELGGPDPVAVDGTGTGFAHRVLAVFLSGAQRAAFLAAFLEHLAPVLCAHDALFEGLLEVGLFFLDSLLDSGLGGPFYPETMRTSPMDATKHSVLGPVGARFPLQRIAPARFHFLFLDIKKNLKLFVPATKRNKNE
jgi:hypothetical protein